MYYRFLLVLLFSLASLEIFAVNEIDKDVVFENYSSRDGLYHPNIRKIVEDKNGYIWLGTSEGLVRFNGNEFNTIRQVGTGNETLSDNSIYSICVDSFLPKLWIGTEFGGVNQVDPQLLTAKNFLNDTTLYSQVDYSIIKSVCQAAPDLLILGTYLNGLYKYIPSTNSYVPIQLDLSSTDSHKRLRIKTTDILKVGNTIWVGSSLGLIKLSLKGDFIEIINPPSLESNFESGIVALEAGTEGDFFFATSSDIWKYSQRDKSISHLHKLSIQDNCITSFVRDWSGNFWVGTNGAGLFNIDSHRGGVKNFRTNYVSKFGIIDNDIEALAVSRNQPILWIGTKTGLSKLDLDNDKFAQVDITGFSGAANVFMIYCDSERHQWLSTPDGLYVKTHYSAEFKRVSTPFSKVNTVISIIETAKGEYLLATTAGLYRYFLNSNRFIQVVFKYDGVNSGSLNLVSGVEHYKNSIYLLSTYVGVVMFDVSNLSYKVAPVPENMRVRGEFQLSDLYVQNDSTVWICSRESALVKFNPLQSSYQLFSTRLENQPFSKVNFVLSIAPDHNGYLWLATYGNGILRFDPKKEIFSDSFAKDDLQNHTYVVYVDSTNCVWVSSNFGISRIDLKTNRVERFGKADGTFCSEFNEGSGFFDSDGTLYFGGTGGYIHFNPYKLARNTYSPPVLISNILYGGEQILPSDEQSDSPHFPIHKTIRISQDKKSISFAFSVLNYSGSEYNRVAYKLMNYDSDWNYAMASDKVVYANLPAGKYTLVTRSSNNNNIWNDEGESVDIVVTAPFYKRPIAWVLSILVVLVLASVIVYYRFRWQKKQKVKLEQLVKAKTSDLERVNEELEVNKIEILAQKGELEMHRNYLEEIVEKRTADLERAKIKAEESDKLKTAFLANLSHEIRTPMNAIIGFSSLLNTNAFSLKEQKEFINLIMESSETLLVLIDDILDISRIETSQISIHPQLIRVGQFMQQLYQTLTFENSNPDTEFLLDIDSDLDLFETETDPTRLKQIISNLAGNALKFTKHGYVKVTAKRQFYALLKNKGYFFKTPIPIDSEVLFFSVEDTGIGIEEKNFEAIFEPFRKIQSPNNEIFGGVGLGLSIVKKLVYLLGGEIQVKSVLGQGSTFYFYLPLEGIDKSRSL